MKFNFFCTLLLIVSFFSSALAQSPHWQDLQGEGNSEERHENGFVRAGNKLILIGGRGLKPLDIFDTREKKWTKGAQPPFEIHHLQAVNLDGLVYVMGAFTGPYPYETPLTHILIYDPLLDTWAIGPEIPANRRRGAAAVVTYNEKIYLVNGIINGHTSGWVHWLDEFDPANNSWRVLPDAPRARDHVHAAVIGDKLYVAGGRRSGFSSETFATTVKETNVYDFNNQQWKELPSPEGDIPTMRAGAAAAVYRNQLLVIGGESGGQDLAHEEVEALEIEAGSWKSLPPLLRGRHGTQAIFFDDMVIIGAGSGNRGGGPELSSFEILTENENPSIASNDLVTGTLEVSPKTIVFQKTKKGQKKQIEIRHTGGNQAVFVSYISLDNTRDFELQAPLKTPFILRPQGKLSLGLVYKGNPANEAPEALILIKTLGKSAPIEVKVRVERN